MCQRNLILFTILVILSRCARHTPSLIVFYWLRIVRNTNVAQCPTFFILSFNYQLFSAPTAILWNEYNVWPIIGCVSSRAHAGDWSTLRVTHRWHEMQTNCILAACECDERQPLISDKLYASRRNLTCRIRPFALKGTSYTHLHTHRHRHRHIHSQTVWN